MNNNKKQNKNKLIKLTIENNQNPEMSTTSVPSTQSIDLENSSKNLQQYNKYKYVVNRSGWVNIFYIFGLVAYLVSFYSFVNIFTINPIIFTVFVILGVFYLMYQVMVFFYSFFYPKFYTHLHEKLTNKFIADRSIDNNFPSVDVYLATCGEPLSVIENTLKHIKAIDYPNFSTYILDDGGDNQLKYMAAQYGFNYFSRPNRGEFKKAGNMQYGYDNTDGKYVLTLDADFAPHKDILKDTIPYLERDEKIGILQTPQHFELSKKVAKRSWIEYGAGLITEDFYRFVQPARDVFGGAICVGTSAIYRKQAIVESGGTNKGIGSEDVTQGLFMNKAGYKVKYIPVVLSQGLCPDSLEGYFKQHNRWCGTSVETFMSEDLNSSRLPYMARISFVMNFLYYITQALVPLISLNIFLMLILSPDQNSWSFLFYTAPYMLYILVLNFFVRVGGYHVGIILASTSNSYTYLYTLIKQLLGSRFDWVPTNAKKGYISTEFVSALSMSFVFSVTYLVLGLFAFYLHPNLLSNPSSYWLIAVSIYIWLLPTTYFYTGLKEVLIKKYQSITNQRERRYTAWTLNTLIFTLHILVLLVIATVYNTETVSQLSWVRAISDSLENTFTQVINGSFGQIGK